MLNGTVLQEGLVTVDVALIFLHSMQSFYRTLQYQIWGSENQRAFLVLPSLGSLMATKSQVRQIPARQNPEDLEEYLVVYAKGVATSYALPGVLNGEVD